MTLASDCNSSLRSKAWSMSFGICRSYKKRTTSPELRRFSPRSILAITERVRSSSMSMAASRVALMANASMCTASNNLKILGKASRMTSSRNITRFKPSSLGNVKNLGK